MRSLRTLGTLALALAGAAALLTACAGSGSGGGTAVAGGVATFAERPGTQPNWIFPFTDQAHNSGYSTGDMQVLMYRPLYWFGTPDGGTGVSDTKSLADAPIYTDNNTKIVINLKPSFRWSNGEAVNADDVLFWMNMMVAEKANWAAYAPGEFPDNVKSVTKTGPQQVTFQLTDSFAPTWFTGDELSQITPLPMAWDKAADSAAPGSGGCTQDVTKCAAVYQYLYNKSKDLSSYATDPLWQVVDGPWHLKSYNADGNIDYLPNPKYSGSDKPHIAEYRMLPFTADTAEYNVLRAGDTVSVGYTLPQDLPQRSGNSPQPASNPLGAHYNLVPAYGWGWSSAMLNYDNPQFGPTFQQLYVRQALQQVLDQDTDVRVAYRGFGVPTTGPVNTAPDNQYIAPVERGDGPYPFDPNAARQRLASHGWTVQNGVMTCTAPGIGANECGAGIAVGTPLSITVLYSNGNTAYQQIMQQWKTDAAKAGIVLNLKPEEFNQLQIDTSSCHGTGPACYWQVADLGYQQYYAVPTGDQLLLPGASGNIMNVNDPKLNSLIDATMHSDSSSAFNDYETYAAQQLPGQINMPIRYFIEAVATNIKGVTYDVVSSGRNPEDWYFIK